MRLNDMDQLHCDRHQTCERCAAREPGQKRLEGWASPLNVLEGRDEQAVPLCFECRGEVLYPGRPRAS